MVVTARLQDDQVDGEREEGVKNTFTGNIPFNDQHNWNNNCAS